MRTKPLVAAVASLAIALTVTACGGGEEAADPNALVVYSAQHEGRAKSWAEAFTADTGIPVVLRSGKDFELANQLVAEGDSSRADLFVTENSPAMTVVDDAGLFSPVDPATLAQVPEELTPDSGQWAPVAARSTVLVYNTEKVSTDQLPASILDLAEPEWQGRWGGAPGGPDFQAIVSAIMELTGEEQTSQWLDGMKDNAKVYSNNITTMQGVNAGEVDAGVIFSYYWYRDQAKTKENTANTALHYFGNQDPGAFLSVSGGGVLKSSAHPDKAQAFLKFITGEKGQQVLADSDALEYTVGSGVAPNPALVPIAELEAPAIDPSTLNGPRVIELMTDKGLI